MTNYLYIIKILITNTNKSYYTTLDRLFQESDDPVSKIYFVVKEYFDNDQSTALSVDDLVVLFHTSYPFLSQKDTEVYESLFAKLRTVEAKPELLDEYILSVKKFVAANELAQAAIDYGHGKSDGAKLRDLFVEVTEGQEADMALGRVKEVTDDLDELLAGHVYTQGLQWRLGALRRSLGPLRKGDFGIVFARPESGKTTFLADQVSFMAESLAEDAGPVGWFNNEEQGEKVKLRVVQAVFGVSLAEIVRHKEHYKAEYWKRIRGKIRIIDESLISTSMVEAWCEKNKPSLLTIDQIDKIVGLDGERRDIMLGEVYKWGRHLAKKYCPVIGVCQSDGSGENVAYLTMGNVADAKTAKQAEADWILGIGKLHDTTQTGLRFFNISKNKLLGGPESLEEFRHFQGAVRFRPEVARYEDM